MAHREISRTEELARGRIAAGDLEGIGGSVVQAENKLGRELTSSEFDALFTLFGELRKTGTDFQAIGDAFIRQLDFARTTQEPGATEDLGGALQPRIEISRRLQGDTETFGFQTIEQIEFALGRPITQEEVDPLIALITEGERQGGVPTEIAEQFISTVQRREAQVSAEQEATTLEERLTTREEEERTQQDLLREAFSVIGPEEENLLSGRLIARLTEPDRIKSVQDLVAEERDLQGQATQEDEDRLQSELAEEENQARLQQEQLRSELQAEVSAFETRAPEERAGLAERLRAEQTRALGEAQPEIEARLQQLGILRSGERIAASERLRGELESERQRTLTGLEVEDIRTLRGLRETAARLPQQIRREDVLFARGQRGQQQARSRQLEETFRQQARQFGLRERELPRAGLESIFGFRTGAAREDITRSQEFARLSGQQARQLGAQSREARLSRGLQQRLAEQDFEFQRGQARTKARRELQGALIGVGTGIFGKLIGAGIGKI